MRTLKAPGSVTSIVAVDSARLAFGTAFGVEIWDIDTGRRVQTLWREAVRDIAVLEEGWLASGHSDGTINIWKLSTGTCTATLMKSKQHEVDDFDSWFRYLLVPDMEEA